MIRVKPSYIPEYLKDSALFANFGEDDEEVSIPEGCCKVDTTVSSSTDLNDLLLTLRFWGVNILPETAIMFMLSRPQNIWKHVADNYERDLSCVASLIEIVNCSRERQICKATEQGNIDVLQYLLDQGYPVEFKADVNAKKYTSHAANIAARKGNLEMLKILQQFNCPFHADTVKAATLSGDVVCFDFLVKNGCPAAEDVVNHAFASGSLECLKYVHETLKSPWTNDLFRELGYCWFDPSIHHNEQGLLQCLIYAQQHGCPHDRNACECCAVHNWPQLLQHLHESGSPWKEDTVLAAASYGHLNCLQYAVEHGCPWDENVFSFAVVSGRVDIVQYLYDRGVPWSENILNQVRFYYGMEDKAMVCLTYVYKLGCPRDPMTCFYASKHGWYDILIDAHEHGCEWDSRSAREAAAAGNLKCLKYLHEHGCPWCQDTTSYALSSRKYDCLKYAIENGCPASNTTMEKYKELVAKGNL